MVAYVLSFCFLYLFFFSLYYIWLQFFPKMFCRKYFWNLLGHGSIFVRPNSSPAQAKAQEYLKPRDSETEGSETFESEASETFESETSKFKALASETLQFRDQGFEFIWMTCDLILSMKFKWRAPKITESDTLYARIRNTNVITTKCYLDLSWSWDG